MSNVTKGYWRLNYSVAFQKKEWEENINTSKPKQNPLVLCLIVLWPWMQIESSYCTPFTTYQNGTPMAPCGAVANSMFNGKQVPSPSALLIFTWNYSITPIQLCPDIARSLVFLPQKALFGDSIMVNMGLCFLLFSNLCLILKLRKIFRLLRPFSMWIYNRTEELSAWWNKERWYNRVRVLPCWKIHSCTVMRSAFPQWCA